MRLTFLPLLLAASIVSACASVSDTTTETIIVDGKAYELRTRTIESGTGSYQTTSVRVNANYYPCLRESPNDCERAVRRAKMRFDRGGG